MFSVIQVNRIYLIFNPVHFLVDSSEFRKQAIPKHARQHPHHEFIQILPLNTTPMLMAKEYNLQHIIRPHQLEQPLYVEMEHIVSVEAGVELAPIMVA